jgi:hypothetical protein
MTINDLSDLVEQYKTDENACTLTCAIQALGEYLYLNLSRYRLALRDEDTRSDFLAWLYPGFPRLLSQYDPAKAGFRTYLNWVVLLNFKTFCREQYGNEARQRVYLLEEQTRILSEMAEKTNTGSWQELLSENVEEYHSNGAKRRRSRTSKNQEMTARKVLLLACKSGNGIDDELLANIVRQTGISEAWLRNRLDTVRQRWMLWLDRLRILREKRYAYYLRAQKSRLEMQNLDPDSTRYAILERDYRYCTKRVDDLKNQCARLQIAPSNRFLAQVLGMCRGTVDSTLASARKHEYSRVS